MPTATRGAAGLILLGALLAQAPSAAARVPSEPSYSGADTTPSQLPSTTPSAAPSAVPTTTPTSGPAGDPAGEPTIAPEPDPTAPDDQEPSGDPVAEPPAAKSWTEVVQEVIRTSPDSSMLRATALADQSKQVMRCFKLETEKYCLGLGFVDKLPSGAQFTEMTATSETSGDTERASSDQDIATGALSPAAFVTERSSLSDGARLDAELEEMQSAWDGRDKARALRELDLPASASDPADPEQAPAEPGAATSPSADATAAPAATPTATPTVTPTPTSTPTAPERSTPTAPGTPKPKPPVSKPPVKLPSSAYIMKGFQTSQDKGYWCGPATLQAIDWADDRQKDTQASWAKDLGATTSGTAISALVKQTNLKTDWDLAAGKYIVQSVGHWNTQKFFAVHKSHLGDGKPAPVIEHVQLLKRYFPYLAFNHSGHYQVGRGYDAKKGTIGIFEVFNERRFNSRGNVTDGPKNIPASALFNATLANQFKNIGL
ncbi:C39 family peptidase [Kribbella sp. CA-293567]|uniref:C39 family peptidase n=1 Tax=Kribbella sp. CA-293567 TaxID=3002436 RepID=UPI0022DCF516|nr:C39 family peptidase [Kribbella sp. CA-293567]WBQ08075.1 C39 family peptidase [Kribbella sp. CA-293567]